MALPDFSVPTEKVVIQGHEFTVRGLYRHEQLAIAEVADKDTAEAETMMIAAGLDEPLEEVRGWYRDVPAAPAAALSDAILRLSGMASDDGRPTQSPSPEG